MSVNKVILIGNLGADIELRKTSGGASVANFNIATNAHFTDSEGQSKEHTEWHTIVVWSKLAENCSKYIKKSSQVYVEGRIQSREWQDKDGNKRISKEIVASKVEFLDKPSQS